MIPNNHIPSTEDVDAAQRLAAIVEFSDDAIIGKDLNGIIRTWNRGAEQIFGYTTDEAVGKSITIIIPPELLDQEPMILDRIAKGERIERFETVRCHKDGSPIFVSLTISPVRDRNGKIVGASKIGRDISDLRRSQEPQALILREMNHRVRNLFAVASGVVALSARSATTPREIASDVQSRLAALARAHQLILPAGELTTHSTTLMELIRTVLQPYDMGDTIAVAGPDVICGPTTCESFALLFHEFATNSVKYGALSSAWGRVRIAWTVDGGLDLNWQEIALGQEPPVRDGTKGFGSLLVEATLRALGGSISREWEPDFHLRLKVPLGRLST